MRGRGGGGGGGGGKRGRNKEERIGTEEKSRPRRRGEQKWIRERRIKKDTLPPGESRDGRVGKKEK